MIGTGFYVSSTLVSNTKNCDKCLPFSYMCLDDSKMRYGFFCPFTLGSID